MDNQDPIIQSMSDNKRNDPSRPNTPPPAPRPQVNTQGSQGSQPAERKGFGEPPIRQAAVEQRTPISYKAPEPPKPVITTPPPSPLTIASKPPEPPKDMKPLYAERPKLPRSEGETTSKVSIILLIATLILMIIGLFALYNKVGGLEKGSTDSNVATKAAVDDLNAKLDMTLQKVKTSDDQYQKCQQDLFDCGSSLQKAAEMLISEGDKLIADGTALKAEGEATKNKDKIDKGQNQIDRGTAMKELGMKMLDLGKSYQTSSGIPRSDK